MGRPPVVASRSDAAPVIDAPRSARQAILDDVRSRLHYLAAELEGSVSTGPGDTDSIVHRLRSLEAALDVLNRSAKDEREHLSHALRTPLNALAGWIGVLREHAGNPATVHQAADVLDRSVSALTRIVDNSTR